MPGILRALLTDEEYAGMMRDFDTAGHWDTATIGAEACKPERCRSEAVQRRCIANGSRCLPSNRR